MKIYTSGILTSANANSNFSNMYSQRTISIIYPNAMKLLFAVPFNLALSI